MDDKVNFTRNQQFLQLLRPEILRAYLREGLLVQVAGRLFRQDLE